MTALSWSEPIHIGIHGAWCAAYLQHPGFHFHDEEDDVQYEQSEDRNTISDVLLIDDHLNEDHYKSPDHILDNPVRKEAIKIDSHFIIRVAIESLI